MLLEAEDRVNKTALLLAYENYQQNYEPFVTNAARLAYVKRDVLAMISGVCEELGADSIKVAARFFEVLAEKAEKKPDSLDEVETTDVMDRGEVEGAGLEEALKPKGLKKEDLGSETSKASRVRAYAGAEAGNLKDKESWKTCFRCSERLNPIAAQRSPVCSSCTEELKQAAPLVSEEPNVTGPVQPSDQERVQEWQCAECAKTQGAAPVVGTKEQIIEHVQQAHADKLNTDTTTPSLPGTPGQTFSSKVAEREEVEVGGEATPADRFDDYIQQVADRAAARQFSQPEEEEIRAIAEQYGLDENDVRENVFTVATFGTFSAANGKPGEVEVPEGYEEVQNVGGRVESHEALIPVETAIAKVADEMNMEKNLVYNMVKDRYGADLPDKYHASISGEHKFYMPATLVGERNDVGPSANPDVAAEEAAPVG